MGLFLVFDVDGTLGPVDGEPEQGPGIGLSLGKASIPINPKILEVIREGVAGRGKTVDALFILSNNSDTGYMARIEARIKELLGTSEPVFDDIMARGDYRRDIRYEDFFIEEGLPVHNPRKSLADVATMIETLNLKRRLSAVWQKPQKPVSTRGLARRVYFFDDLIHYMKDEIPADQYIHITPSYTGSRGYKDRTRYFSLLARIRGIKGVKGRITRTLKKRS
jgi:hypothetical protein